MKVHDLRELADQAYHVTQTDDSIKDGDVLQLSDGMFGIMVQAWPAYLHKYEGECHQFHHIETTWKHLGYEESAKLAYELENSL